MRMQNFVLLEDKGKPARQALRVSLEGVARAEVPRRTVRIAPGEMETRTVLLHNREVWVARAGPVGVAVTAIEGVLAAAARGVRSS